MNALLIISVQQKYQLQSSVAYT